MDGTGGQAVTRIQTFIRAAVLPWLDMTCQEHSLGAERRGTQAAEHTPAATVGQHVKGEHMLPDPGRCQQNPFGLQLGPRAFGGMPGDLTAQFSLQHGKIELLLAKQRQLASVLQSEEIRQASRAYALGAGRTQQHTVDAAEARWGIPKQSASENVPSSAVGTRTIQVGHLRQHAGRRPGEQPRQGRHRLRCLMRSATAEVTVIDQKRGTRHSSVSTGEKTTCLPPGTGRRARSALN